MGSVSAAVLSAAAAAATLVLEYLACRFDRGEGKDGVFELSAPGQAVPLFMLLSQKGPVVAVQGVIRC